MLSFAHPAFLLALAAIGVPVFLHLMNRAIPVRLQFPTVRFIRKAQMPREGRRSLRDLLVLIFRLLLLTAIVLLFSGPIWHPSRNQAIDETGNSETIVIVDVSSSMAGWQGMDTVREQFTRLLQERKASDIGLIFSADGVATAHPPGTAKAILSQAVAAAEPQPVQGDHLPALSEAARLFRPGKAHTLVIMSDFQQTDWQLAGSPTLPPGTTLELIDVAPGRASNAGITHASVRPLGGGAVRVVAEVRNFGNTPVERQVALNSGSDALSRSISIPPLQVRKTAFVLDAPGNKTGVLSLSADDYAPDNSYHFWLGRFPPVKLLAVLPLEQEPQKENELFFIRKALSVVDDSDIVSFNLEHVGSDMFFALNLEDVQALLLLGAAGHFREQEFKLVREFLERGGLVICTPGAAAAHQFHGLQQHGILPASFVSQAGGHTTRHPELFGLGSIRPNSILSRAFADPEATDLFLFSIYKYARVKPTDDTKALMWMLDGSPALLENIVGRGRIFASMFAFDPTWSDFPMTGSFLPLLRELLSVAVPQDHGVKQLDCGQPLPEQKDLLDNAVSPDRAAPQSTAAPGVVVQGNVPYEINVSRRESVVDKVNLIDLKSRLTATSPGAPPAAETAPDAVEGSQRQLWPWCAAVASLLFLVELLLIGFLDRRELAGRGMA